MSRASLGTFASGDGESANVNDEIDPAFVNDKYNLLFPLQFYWDGADVRDMDEQKLPPGRARRSA